MLKPITILVSVDSNSVLLGARHYKNYLSQLVEKYNLDSVTDVLETGSFGNYGEGVLISILPENIHYAVKSEKDIELIVQEHLLKGRRVPSLIVEKIEKEETEE